MLAGRASGLSGRAAGRRTRASLLALALAIALPQAVRAESEADPAAAGSAASAAGSAAQAGQTYPAAYFSRFAPRTAQDMLQQVPGFVIRESEEARGFGQASSNVLLNGQRLSGKSEDTLTQLARVPAANVQRIDIVDAATLEVPGLTGQVANIIVKAGGLSGSYAWKPEFRAHYTAPLYTRGEISLSGHQGPVEFTLGLTNEANRGGAGGITLITAADGALIERRDDVVLFSRDRPKLSATVKLDGPGSSEANLNASYQRNYIHGRNDDSRQRPGGVDSARAFREDVGGYNYELGADFAFRLGPGRLKLIGLLREDHEPYSQQTVFTYADGAAATGDRFEQVQDESERVLRGEYGWKLGGADWQLSAEAAFNRLDNVAALYTLSPAGAFTAVPFPGGSGGVTEDRYESILSYSRPLTSKLSLQLTGGGEYSRLATTGAAAQVREFWRPKGSLSLAWAAAKGVDVSFKASRKVGQLDFGDFLAQVFLEDGNENAGNAALVPPQSWEFEIEAKKNLGKWGTSTLRLFDYRIEDLVDIVPVGTDSESLGNIASARRRGIEWTSTFQLAPLGFRGAKLDAYVALEKSRVRDPLTGQLRQISETQDRTIEMELRHDIPRSNLAWGVGFSNYHFQPYYRLGEVGLAFEGPTWGNVFIEHKNVGGLTMRFTFRNLFNGRNLFDRVVHTGWRDRTPVAFAEHRDRLIGPIFSFSVRGTI